MSFSGTGTVSGFCGGLFVSLSVLGFGLILLLVSACIPREAARPTTHSLNPSLAQTKSPPLELKRICFGSCAHQDKPQPILKQVVAHQPDLFIFLGDNVYGDSENMGVLRKKYTKLAQKQEFKDLWKSTYILSTWDDHDFGLNDGGRHYNQKEASKELFIKFWGQPAGSDRGEHQGIYTSLIYGETGKKVQVILLDTRTFRDDLLPANDPKLYKNDYRPNPSADSTFLGEAQWNWLKNQFLKSADLRIIATSNQFGIEYNGYEAWANVPKEQEKMVSLIRETQANGVIFISGDVHWGELSRLETPDCYPLYDVTSSGITQTWNHIEPNANRLYKAEALNNFGEINIDWSKSDPEISLKIHNVKGETSLSHTLFLSELRF